MTSQPEVPGAAAVYLFKEEITDDNTHTRSMYARIKVLTEAGKKYADVELRSYSLDAGGGYSISGIAGRTIHPDGTILPFTGKPFDKLIEKGRGFREMATSFSLPDVGIGSIIEYRYELVYDSTFHRTHIYYTPRWFVQSDLFTRRAHYQFNPLTKITTDDGTSETFPFRWIAILPKGDEVKVTKIQGSETLPGPIRIELNISAVPPASNHAFLPLVENYRVLFYFKTDRKPDEFWRAEGNNWAKERDRLIGPGPKVKAAVNNLVTSADSPDLKLRKIYAELMKLDNTSDSRAQMAPEERWLKNEELETTDEIWERKRGSGDEIAELFVSMARAAGMKAYLMEVTNRNRSLFLPDYTDLTQLDDEIAIVNIEGKETYFDPGQRYCPYGQLAWKHTLAGGVRQTDEGAQIADTPEQGYKDSRTDRIADLIMNERGEATGTVTMTYSGAPALQWRQDYLSSDTTSLNDDLRTAMETLMPAGMEIKVKSIEKLNEYEEPLVVKYDVKGRIATGTGERLLIPSDIFEVNTNPAFTDEKRERPVYLDCAFWVLDAVRVTFPASLRVETMPSSDEMRFQKSSAYTFHTQSTPTSVTVHRNLLIGDVIFDVSQIPGLRAFYNKFEIKDQEPIALKAAAPAAGAH